MRVARARNTCFIQDWGYYPELEMTGEDTAPTDAPAPQPAAKCRRQDPEGECLDINARDCPAIQRAGQCYQDYMLTYTRAYCKRTCGFCGRAQVADLVEDCVERVADNTCKDDATQVLCARTCCVEEEEPDNGACPGGTTRCPDGACRHIHMC